MRRIAAAFLLVSTTLAQPQPKHYTCPRAGGPLKIDGRLDDKAWRAAPWTDDFIDIQGADHPRPRFRARERRRRQRPPAPLRGVLPSAWDSPFPHLLDCH